MALTIYGIAASRVLRPLWVAAELGLDFEHVRTPYQGGATRTAEFLALNPNGHIPVLVDARPEGELVVWESMACTLYLARQHGPADRVSLTPATPREDAEALRWSFWTVNELEKDALTVLMHRLVMPAAPLSNSSRSRTETACPWPGSRGHRAGCRSRPAACWPGQTAACLAA